jgi:hypothetical protein
MRKTNMEKLCREAHVTLISEEHRGRWYEFLSESHSSRVNYYLFSIVTKEILLMEAKEQPWAALAVFPNLSLQPIYRSTSCIPCSPTAPLQSCSGAAIFKCIPCSPTAPLQSCSGAAIFKSVLGQVESVESKKEGKQASRGNIWPRTRQGSLHVEFFLTCVFSQKKCIRKDWVRTEGSKTGKYAKRGTHVLH